MKGEMQWWDCDNVGDDLRLDHDNDRKLRSHEEMVECSRSTELIRGNVKAEASKTKMLVSISLKKKNSTLKKAVVLFKVLMDLVASHFRRNSEKGSES
jgi:flagellar basal body-associated protein FliL